MIFIDILSLLFSDLLQYINLIFSIFLVNIILLIDIIRFVVDFKASLKPIRRRMNPFLRLYLLPASKGLDPVTFEKSYTYHATFFDYTCYLYHSNLSLKDNYTYPVTHRKVSASSIHHGLMKNLSC